MSLRRLLVVAGVLLLSAPLALAAGSRSGVAVEGDDRARILTPAGAVVVPYENAGYRLELDPDGAVRVSTWLDPLASSAPYATRATVPDTSAVARLAHAVTVGAGTEYEAVSRILGWMARHLDYALDRSMSQEPEAVLERRSGYCTGIARLAVAMVRSVGIPAREVAGYVVEPRPGEPPAGGASLRGFHRWIEVRLADRGWVMSDPLASHHYVPASYVRLASELVIPRDGLDGLLIERRDRRTPVDLFPAAPVGITVRRNDDRQRAAALRVHIADQRQGTAILESDQRRLVHALSSGGTTFVGLDPGRYMLRLLLPGLPEMERLVELEGLVRKAILLPAPRPPGRGADPSTSPITFRGLP